MFDAKNIAVIAVIMIIGLGGNYAFGGNIPFLALISSSDSRRAGRHNLNLLFGQARKRNRNTAAALPVFPGRAAFEIRSYVIGT